MKDCGFVIHVAGQPVSSQQGATTNEDDVVKPVLDGLNAVLKACQKEKVKRLVLTSSVNTVLGKCETVTC